MTRALDASRRRVLTALAGAGVWAAAGRAFARASARTGRVVIAGGGFAGASCALALRRLAPELEVVLVDRQAAFVTGPFCNTVIAGMRPLRAITQNHRGLTAAGVRVVHAEIEGADPRARALHLADGRRVHGDRLVLGPGIDFRWQAIDGYGPAAVNAVPHAWPGGAGQLATLRAQLRAMPENGRVIIGVPEDPYRCPPGPYERASLIAHFLRRHKPKARVLVLDAKTHFVKEPLFRTGWATLYADRLDWLGRADGARVVAVDVAARRVRTAGGDEFGADVVNLIPPQKAGRLAAEAGLIGPTGWVDVAAHDFSVPDFPGVHVIGDAAHAPPLPKSGYAANMQAKVCAQGIAAELAGRPVADTTLLNACFSLLAPDYGISVIDVYRLHGDRLAAIRGSGGLSALAAAPATRARAAAYARSWYQNIVHDSFGI